MEAHSNDELLLKSLQESIISLLIYRNDNPTKIISTLIDISWFDPPYRQIAEVVLLHWEHCGEAPGLYHSSLMLELILEQHGKKREAEYAEIFKIALDAEKHLNSEVILKHLSLFARKQTLRNGLYQAATGLMNARDATDFDKIENGLYRLSTANYGNEDLGFSLADTERSLAFFDPARERDRLTLGIPELDAEGINPARGEVFLFIGSRGKGKTMFLQSVGRAAISRPDPWNCLHISLENKEVHTASRYIQGTFDLVKRDSEVSLLEFVREDNEIVQFVRTKTQFDVIRPELREELEYNIRNNRSRNGDSEVHFDKLWIKKFPTKSLSFEQFVGFIERLKVVHGFIPDIILLDYPKLMNYVKNDPRIDLGDLIQQLRGLAEILNCAMVIVAQINRIGENSSETRSTHIAEDITQVDHADYVIGYSQTKVEQQVGMARLGVEKARNEKGGFTVLIAQNYAASQFCTASGLMRHSTDISELLRKISDQLLNEKSSVVKMDPDKERAHG